MGRKRNVLFITTDQQHWKTLGYLNPEVRTPNLDRLVKRGTTFHRAYAPNPTCTPTRASWITGLYPSQHGAYSLGTRLMENVPTVGDAFDKAGYRTALVGKAHFQPLRSTDEYPSLEAYPILHDLEFWRNFNGPFYGFRHVELARNHTDESHVGQHYALWLEEKAPGKWRDWFLPTDKNLPADPAGFPVSRRESLKPGQPWDIPEELHYNAWIAERTNALMDGYKNNGDNFFLWASFFDPHPQYMVPEPYAGMYDPAKVTVPEFREGEFDDKPPYFQWARQEHGSADMADYVEEGMLAIHGAGSHLSPRETKAENIAAMYGMVTMLDTYIGRILDNLERNGLAEDTLVCFTSDHGDFWGQHGLTHKAIHHYEDLLRVPLVVSMPGTVPEGVVSNALQSTVDLPQTFLDMAGPGAPRTMAGVTETDVWTGKKATLREHVIIENQHQPTVMHLRTYVDERYKLTLHYRRAFGELYDLQEDPGEYVNLWDHEDKQDLKKDLLLKFMYAEMAKSPRPMPRIYGA